MINVRAKKNNVNRVAVYDTSIVTKYESIFATEMMIISRECLIVILQRTSFFSSEGVQSYKEFSNLHRADNGIRQASARIARLDNRRARRRVESNIEEDPLGENAVKDTMVAARE